MIRSSLRRGRGPAAPRSCKDDTGLDDYDTLAGHIWRPRRAGQQARSHAPGSPTAHPPSATTRPEPELVARTG